jgi:hypothetical protein
VLWLLTGFAQRALVAVAAASAAASLPLHMELLGTFEFVANLLHQQ